MQVTSIAECSHGAFCSTFDQHLGLPRLHVKTTPFRVSAINVYKIGLPFTRTLARDQHRGLQIALPIENYSLKQ